MKNKCNKEKSGTLTTLLAAVIMIGTVAGGTYGLTEVAVAAENNKIITLPTTYAAVSAPAAKKVQSQTSAPDGYVKPDYTLVDNDLEYYKDKKPTANDISREQAAEIGVRGLVSVFNIDLSGKEIEMSYNPAERGLRATWDGIWWYNGKKKPDDLYVASYSFTIDAITGNLEFIRHDRVLPSNIQPGFDVGLHGNNQDYLALAEKAALKYGAISGSVKKSEYSGQGSSNNDPQIWFDLVGADGTRARITLSRHDKVLVGVDYDAGMRSMDEQSRVQDQEFAIVQQRAAEYFAANPGATTYWDEEYKAQVDKDS